VDEIERCQPRFLCLLGGRYGLVPAPREVDARSFGGVLAGTSAAGALSADERTALEALYEPRGERLRLREDPRSPTEAQRWRANGDLAVHVLQRAGLPAARRSITASEVHFGALERLHVPAFRYFYFRSDRATESVPAPFAQDYREAAGSLAAGMLAELKARLRAARGQVLASPAGAIEEALPVREYDATWDARGSRFVGLDALGQMVYEDLLASVSAELGDSAPVATDELLEESVAADAFIERHTTRFVLGDRASVLDALFQHAGETTDPGVLVLVGEPGSGKSALLGQFQRAWEAANPDALVLSTYVGVGPGSSSVRRLLGLLCRRLARELTEQVDVPEDEERLRSTFRQLLDGAARLRPVVLLVDAVNQLEAGDARALRWLLAQLPNGVRVILSTPPGPTLDLLRRLPGPPLELPLPALSQSDAVSIVEVFLDRYRKRLDASQKAALLEKRGATSPLFLLIALEELRTLGTYEEITERIRVLPEETAPLFRWVLRRLAADDGFRDRSQARIGSDLVRRYCSLLAVSRGGLTPEELAAVVSPGHRGLDEAPDALGNVAALERLLRPYLMTRGDLVDFFHGALRAAVEEAYLPDGAARTAAHQELATFFRRAADPSDDETWQGASARGLSELPYHLTEAAMWDELCAVLTDVVFLEEKCTHVAIQTVIDGSVARRLHGGVYELQRDYARALEKLPASF